MSFFIGDWRGFCQFHDGSTRFSLLKGRPFSKRREVERGWRKIVDWWWGKRWWGEEGSSFILTIPWRSFSKKKYFKIFSLSEYPQKQLLYTHSIGYFFDDSWCFEEKKFGKTHWQELLNNHNYGTRKATLLIGQEESLVGEYLFFIARGHHLVHLSSWLSGNAITQVGMPIVLWKLIVTGSSISIPAQRMEFGRGYPRERFIKMEENGHLHLPNP